MTAEAVSALPLGSLIKTNFDWFDEILKVRSGTVISVFGPPGSSKTSLIRRIAHAMPSGSVLELGCDTDADGISRLVGRSTKPDCRMITVEHDHSRTDRAIKDRIWALRTLVEDRSAFAMVEMHKSIQYAVHNADTALEMRMRFVPHDGSARSITELRVTKNRHDPFSGKWIEVPTLVCAAP